MAELATKTLLIVEDNAVTRESLSTILSCQGYSVRGVANGGQALEALRAAKPNLILLDMLLSGAGDDGWTLLDKLRRHSEWHSIPVIIVTGILIASDEWALSLGAQAVVHKPIDTDELLSKVKCHCP
ncbi:MAG TPA: response regulator [Gemmataceae bacterium]|jgi:CheY-like chemotaxis protein